tara:strand:+ start:2633 stop:3853 length:1221 start_codon:yes stop_codon:yes gene_type:complete
MKKVLVGALELVKPDVDERKEVNTAVTSFLTKLNKGLKGMKAVLGGSGAKGTWTKGIRDADIYMKFGYAQYNDKSDGISDLLEKELKKRFKGVKRLHGSRDYFQTKDNGFLFEIIPILDIRNSKQAVNITDISPLHTKFVSKHKKIADDILLAKGFCKSIGVYGAESFIKGFSGYVIEILTIHYKGFEGFVKNISKWKDKTILDPAKYHKNVMFEVNKSKLESPLVLIDPVEEGRNAAAALGEDKYRLLISKCKSFMKKPGLSYFTTKEFSADSLKGKDLIVYCESLSGKMDVVGSKLLKVFEMLNKRLGDFGPKGDWHWDQKNKAYLWFSFKSKKLSNEMVFNGPPIELDKHVKIFKKKYKNAFVKNGRVFAKIKRKYTIPDELVLEVIKDNYVKEKVKKICLMK